MDAKVSEVATQTQTVSGPKARRIAFRIVAILVAIFTLLLSIFGLIEIILMWIPLETIAALGGEDVSSLDPEEIAIFTIHRSHFMVVGIVSWVIVLSVLTQLRRAERKVAPMLLLVSYVLAAAVFYALSGTLQEWLIEEVLVVVVPIGMVALLHPSSRHFLEKTTFDRTMGVLAALAAVPWLLFMLGNASDQLANVAGDAHAEVEHWATAAVLAVLMIAASFLGASGHSGWRLPARLAAFGTTLFGVHSLVYPGNPSGLSTFWALAAILWGVVYAVALTRRSRDEKRAVVA